MKIVIPARRNSKGFPFKNRALLHKTLSLIPSHLKNDVIISTDDEYIQDAGNKEGLYVLQRDPITASDTASMKSVLLEVVDKMSWNGVDIITLYLTYPQRTWKTIEEALSFYKERAARSLLCASPAKDHPYRLFYKKEGGCGKCVVDHNLHRRQTYPDVFLLCHYIIITNSNELPKLKDNLYNEDTVFFPIGHVLDIDTEEDYKEYVKCYEETHNACKDNRGNWDKP